MPKFQGYLIRKEYFKIEVEAEDWSDAKDKILDAEIDDEPVDIDWDVYDIEEVVNA
jgi:hypothetical protein